MKLEFLEPAEKELNDAINYYNRLSPGLGFEFALEIKRTLQRILHYPDAWTPLSKRTRRCLTNRFPYGVIYQKRDDKILIIAIMNLRQRPNSWKNR
ncbi:MAG TPA: type II toxin-antitoxin system RelE/ParE family toxin [bacterium]|nr:type II toxin-antitoxin system RelE/ParE family toxin [bacterium]HPG46932.1 type II toxin-antitoxin system RelE/ParE family toxin [bacterium]HPM99296.1 type II toxin-antitoxin system RelE/ParE family toxin [bacterium]